MGTTPDVPTDVAVHPDGLERHWQIAGFRRPRDLAVGYRGTHALQCRIQYHGCSRYPGWRGASSGMLISVSAEPSARRTIRLKAANAGPWCWPVWRSRA